MHTTTDEFLHALFSASDEHKSRALKILKGECPEVSDQRSEVGGAPAVEPYVTLREAARPWVGILVVSSCTYCSCIGSGLRRGESSGLFV